MGDERPYVFSEGIRDFLLGVKEPRWAVFGVMRIRSDDDLLLVVLDKLENGLRYGVMEKTAFEVIGVELEI